MVSIRLFFGRFVVCKYPTWDGRVAVRIQLFDVRFVQKTYPSLYYSVRDNWTDTSMQMAGTTFRTTATTTTTTITSAITTASHLKITKRQQQQQQQHY